MVAPSRSLAFNLGLGGISGLFALGGIGLIMRSRWGKVVAGLSSALMLLFTAVILVLLVSSAAYLKATYSSMGQGMTVISWLLAALVIELFALLPWFQLRFLIRTWRD